MANSKIVYAHGHRQIGCYVSIINALFNSISMEHLLVQRVVIPRFVLVVVIHGAIFSMTGFCSMNKP